MSKCLSFCSRLFIYKVNRMPHRIMQNCLVHKYNHPLLQFKIIKINKPKFCKKYAQILNYPPYFAILTFRLA